MTKIGQKTGILNASKNVHIVAMITAFVPEYLKRNNTKTENGVFKTQCPYSYASYTTLMTLDKNEYIKLYTNLGTLKLSCLHLDGMLKLPTVSKPLNRKSNDTFLTSLTVYEKNEHIQVRHSLCI